MCFELFPTFFFCCCKISPALIPRPPTFFSSSPPSLPFLEVFVARVIQGSIAGQSFILVDLVHRLEIDPSLWCVLHPPGRAESELQKGERV